MPARTTVRTATLLLAVSAVTALTLTGCQGDTGGSRHGRKHNSAGKAGGSSHRKDVSDNAPACDPADFTVSIKAVPAPADHALITATNTSDRTCEIYGYPQVHFDGAQAAPVAERNGSPVALLVAPDESAYSGVLTTVSEDPGSEAPEAYLDLRFSARSLTRTVGAPTRLKLTGKVYTGADTISFWQRSSEAALGQ